MQQQVHRLIHQSRQSCLDPTGGGDTVLHHLIPIGSTIQFVQHGPVGGFQPVTEVLPSVEALFQRLEKPDDLRWGIESETIPRPPDAIQPKSQSARLSGVERKVKAFLRSSARN